MGLGFLFLQQRRNKEANPKASTARAALKLLPSQARRQTRAAPGPQPPSLAHTQDLTRIQGFLRNLQGSMGSQHFFEGAAGAPNRRLLAWEASWLLRQRQE